MTYTKGKKFSLLREKGEKRKKIVGGWLLWWLRGSVVYGGFSQTPWGSSPAVAIFFAFLLSLSAG